MALSLQIRPRTSTSSMGFGIRICTHPSVEFRIKECTHPSMEFGFCKCTNLVECANHKYRLPLLEWSRKRRDNTSPRDNVGSSQVRLVATEAVRAGALEMERKVFGHAKLNAERLSEFNTEVNKASKWIAVVATASTVVWRHDEAVLWATTGAIANGLFCQILKNVINESRPPTADGLKRDPGMPSSHAQGFSFLSTYAALALLLWKGPQYWTLMSAACIFLLMIYLSWLRIADGLHTHAQVIVGSILGSTGAMCWLWIWKSVVEASIHSFPFLRSCLFILFGVCCVLTYITNFKDWEFGKH